MKKLFTGIAAALLVAALAVPAFAATLSDNSRKEINDLYDQIAGLRKQVVQEYVDAGVLTETEGDKAKQNIDNFTEYQKDNSENPGLGAGFGCGGGGSGMMGDYTDSGYYGADSGTVSNAVQTI